VDDEDVGSVIIFKVSAAPLRRNAAALSAPATPARLRRGQLTRGTATFYRFVNIHLNEWKRPTRKSILR